MMQKRYETEVTKLSQPFFFAVMVVESASICTYVCSVMLRNSIIVALHVNYTLGPDAYTMPWHALDTVMHL